MKRKPTSVKTAPNVDDDLESGELSPRMNAFCREYVIDSVGTSAYIRAGYSEVGANQGASRLLANVKVQENIRRRLAAAADAAQVSAELVISEIYQVATGDPRDLVSVHRGACRWCWGIDGDRQWTVGEYKDAMYQATAADPNAPAPPLRGGLGYDFTREANLECLECRGFGTERVIVKDTRTLSRGAAKLIASIKQARDGSIELKHRDQDGALMALGKITGVIRDRQEWSGPNGGPLQLQPVPAPLNSLSNQELEEILRRNGNPLPVLDGHSLTDGATND